MVVCCAWLLETATATLFVGARYELGWYAGRSFGIAATFVVLLVLLSETLILYANLARSIVRQRNERHARQIAIDAMAASIAHEIRQPLASIALNGDTALHCLTGATSSLDAARDALRCVVDDSHRASAVISGIRSMFQKGARGQVLLDVNELVRETLTMIDLDLRTYGISVKADLRDGVLHLSGRSRPIAASISEFDFERDRSNELRDRSCPQLAGAHQCRPGVLRCCGYRGRLWYGTRG